MSDSVDLAVVLGVVVEPVPVAYRGCLLSEVLLSDFSDCGMEGTALSLLESYLENREQCVAVGEHQSEPTILQYGVPQGSVLGPVLFSVYTGTLSYLLDAHGVNFNETSHKVT